ncbi:unnamed protein product [Gemmataceae bacterium]|nr:unnamed protein product [Gemmataceae bacterium]VTT96807.1 unnamed protein product [Gemmataceae bacterium]
MFKSVEYAGFESHPELRATAERLTPVLGNEIRTWRDQVSVEWRPGPDAMPGSLELTLTLTLENGVAGEASGTFTSDDLGEAWLERSRCRWVWDGLLEVLLDKQHQRTEEYLSAPAEV